MVLGGGALDWYKVIEITENDSKWAYATQPGKSLGVCG